MSENTKTVLITGASGGIGIATAELFAKNGYDLYLWCSSEKSLSKFDNLKNNYKNNKIVTTFCDVTNSQNVDEEFKKVVADCGKLDVLVNNAGITRDTLLLRMDDKAFDDVINTNLKGTFYLTRAAVAAMAKARGGNIINVSSVVGLHGNAGQANYSASKAGIIGLTKSVAREYAKRGIIVNAIAPGAVNTPMLNAIGENALNALLGTIPLGRTAEPEEVAELIYFLSNTKYITGQVISIDGGMGI